MAIHHADLLGVSDDVLRNIPLEHWEDDLSAIYNEGRRVRLFHSVNGHDELIVVVLHQKGGDKGQKRLKELLEHDRRVLARPLPENPGIRIQVQQHGKQCTVGNYVHKKTHWIPTGHRWKEVCDEEPLFIIIPSHSSRLSRLLPQG